MLVLALVDELIPLYPVYALLFADAGLSSGQISALYAIWSLVAFVLEVPLGAFADRIPRRSLLVGAQLVRAVGFGCWVVWPSFAGFALGFVLWGASGAAWSGTWEALLYDELGSAERYVRVVGRATALAAAGSLGATALAGPIIAAGGYPAAGWASVATCLVAAVIAAGLPASGGQQRTDHDAASGYLGTLRSGVVEAVRSPAVGRLVLIVALLSGVTAVEEYFALLAGGFGLPAGALPLLMLLPAAGYLVGAEWGGQLGRLSPRRAAWLVAVGAVLFGLGALSARPVGFVGIAVGYGVFECVGLIAGARLQTALTGPRATVTSIAAVAEEVVALAVFAGFGAFSPRVSLPVLVAVSAAPVIGLAVLLPRWLPRPGAD